MGRLTGCNCWVHVSLCGCIWQWHCYWSASRRKGTALKRTALNKCTNHSRRTQFRNYDTSCSGCSESWLMFACKWWNSMKGWHNLWSLWLVIQKLKFGWDLLRAAHSKAHTFAHMCLGSIFRHVCRIVKSHYWLWHVCLSVCLSICMEELSCHWMDYYEICYLRIFLKCVLEINFQLNVTRISGCFIWSPVCIYDIMLNFFIG